MKLSFKKLLQKLLDLNQVTSKQCDNAQAQLLEFMDSVKVNRAEFESCDRKLCRLDEFYFSKIGVEKFPLVIKLVLTLIHDQASIERGFSVSENLVVENLKESSLIAQRIISDHMKSKELNPETIDITKHLVLGVTSAKQKYTAHLEKQKKTKKLSDKEKRQKALQDDIDEVLQKKRALEKLCDSLQVDFENLVSEAETKNDMTYVVKAKALKRKVNEKSKEMKKLEETAKELMAKKRKLV